MEKKYYAGVGVDRESINHYSYNGKVRRMYKAQTEIGVEVSSRYMRNSTEWENDVINQTFDTLKGTDWGAVTYMYFETYER